jgi:hypothetical protein
MGQSQRLTQAHRQERRVIRLAHARVNGQREGHDDLGQANGTMTLVNPIQRWHGRPFAD